jgi:protein ImuB
MALRGCIEVACLPLRILLLENPSWKETTVAVTKEEKPRSPILALNQKAREQGLAVGMRYAQALALVPGLRARAVSRERIAEAREAIMKLLSAFTPDIEPCPFDMDAFWVSVDGLKSLFSSEYRWAESVRHALDAKGFPSTIAVGFTRFGTYAIARSRPRTVVFTSREEERLMMEKSSIDILPLSLKAKAALRKLGVRSVRRFVALPQAEMEKRFGKEAAFLRSAILSDDPLPIQPRAIRDPPACARRLDAPVADLALLMPHIDELLAVETKRVEAEKSVISALTLTLRSENGEVTMDVIRPAVPTLRAPLLSRLVQLRLCARQFSSAVESIELRTSRTDPSRRQEELFTVKGRDLDAGARTFAALRARFGNESVSCAQLRDSHLPERSFTWIPLARPSLPAARGGGGALPEAPTAVRRVFFKPKAASESAAQAGSAQAESAQAESAQAESAQADSTWQGSTLPGSAASGRFLVSGSWWGTNGEDAPFIREYSYRHSHDGLLWLFADRLTGEAWIQGAVD